MNGISHFLIIVSTGVLLCLVSTEGIAQTGGSNGPDFIVPRWDVMPDSARALVEEGDVLVGNQAYGEARSKYLVAAELTRAEGGFPSMPLRRIAESYYFEGRYQTAIAALDELAEEAADVGDIVTQAWARADAAWVLWVDCEHKNRPVRNPEMTERTNQLRRLLASPYLPDEDRETIRAKRCGGCHTADMFAKK